MGYKSADRRMEVNFAQVYTSKSQIARECKTKEKLKG
jgi:hypothetical protein